MNCRIKILLLALCLGPYSFAQQTHENQSAMVEVKASPEKVLPAERVTISGSTDIDARTSTVQILITNTLNHNAARLSAVADKEGNFKTVFEKTQTAGKYEVVVNSPSGKASGKTSFIVTSPGGLAEDVGSEYQKGVSATQKVLDQVTQMVPALPDSPPKQELQERLRKLGTQMAEFQKRVPDTVEAFNKLKRMLDQVPQTGKPLDKYTRQMLDFVRHSEEKREHEPELTKANTQCDQLDRINEGLNWASLLFDFSAKAVEFVNNVFYDKFATDALSSILNVENETGKVAISQFLKVGLAGGSRAASQYRLKETVDVQGTIVAFMGDIAQFVVQKIFGMSCESFNGTFTASLNTEFSKNLEPWWRYSEDLAGVLSLRYPKNSAPGKPVPMTGEFQGVVTKYTVWENAISVLFPHLDARTATFRVRRPPIGTPFDPVEMKLGKVAFNLFPKAFHIPVKAEYDKDKIRVYLQPETTEVKEVAKITYVFFNAATLLVPVITTAELPYKDAFFVLDHATDAGYIELPVTSQDGKLFLAARELQNTSGTKGKAEGTYKLDIKICNPSCP